MTGLRQQRTSVLELALADSPQVDHDRRTVRELEPAALEVLVAASRREAGLVVVEGSDREVEGCGSRNEGGDGGRERGREGVGKGEVEGEAAERHTRGVTSVTERRDRCQRCPLMSQDEGGVHAGNEREQHPLCRVAVTAELVGKVGHQFSPQRLSRGSVPRDLCERGLGRRAC